MADEAAVFFTPDGKATPLLLARWRAKGGLSPPQAGARYIEPDRSATQALRGLWRVAFPDRSPLPFGPIVTAEGKFNDTMLNVWL